MMHNVFHDTQITAKSDTYYIPTIIAEKLCSRIRANVEGQWRTWQWWACQRCTVLGQKDDPRGLRTAEVSHYRCKAIAERYGYKE